MCGSPPWGAASTVTYVALFALLRQGLGAQAANLAALLVTAVANPAANRRVTFRASGGRGAGHHQFRGLPVFLLALAFTGGALALLQPATPSPGLAVELAVLTAANLAASVLRFLLLRSFVFRSRRRSPA